MSPSSTDWIEEFVEEADRKMAKLARQYFPERQVDAMLDRFAHDFVGKHGGDLGGELPMSVEEFEDEFRTWARRQGV